MTRDQRQTADRLASAAMLALDGETMRGAAHQLGFEDANALAVFLTEHRRVATAKRLWANGHPSRTPRRSGRLGGKS